MKEFIKNKLCSFTFHISSSINTLVNSLLNNTLSVTPNRSPNIFPGINTKSRRRATEKRSHGRSERCFISVRREEEYGLVETYPVFTIRLSGRTSLQVQTSEW